jgi:Tfp pilus assembly protein PilN
MLLLQALPRGLNNMLQFNLLPDVKKEYIKAKRTKRLIFSIATISAAVAVVIVLLLFSIVQFAQKKSINDLTKDIESGINELKDVEDLDKILTIQNQLNALPGLHESKPETSRLFNYLTQITPFDVKIGAVQINFVDNTIKIEGIAPSIASVNRFTDTIKFATYTSTSGAESETAETTQDSEKLTAFTDVTTELSRNEERATYEINATFDPVLFNNAQTVVLIIPNTVTTRSTQGKPTISNTDENPLFDSTGGDE